MDVHKIAVIQASLGGFDTLPKHVLQNIQYDYYFFTDENFPPRNALTPRMQAKIPKLFGWQLVPDYEYYLWLDGNIQLNEGALQYFLDNCEDAVFYTHPSRPNIRQEVRYLRKGLREQSRYLVSRYDGDLHKEMYEIIEKDSEYVDDLLLAGGAFMYKNTDSVRSMMKEWWYYITRYIIQDQIPLPYVLKKSGINYNVLTDNIYDTPHLTIKRHGK